MLYLLAIICAIAMPVGGIIAAMRDAPEILCLSLLMAALPLAALIIAAAWLNHAILIPRLLLRRRYLIYALCCLTIGMVIPLTGLALEAAIRQCYALPARIHNFQSPWILLDSLSTAALLAVIMAGMGVVSIYRLWMNEAESERHAAAEYAAATATLKNTLPPHEILSGLDSVIELASNDADAAEAKLRQLSDRLRHELYELPAMKVYTPRARSDEFSWLSDFISAKRYTLMRDICLKILIMCVSLTAIFDVPDSPNLTRDGLLAFLSMFIVMCILTYGNKILSKHFLNKGKLRRYITAATIFLAVITFVAIIFEYLAYEPTLHTAPTPLLYQIIAIICSCCTLALYFGGITALIVLHNWIRTVGRIAAFDAETTRAEFLFLQSQINPHFLFNVLNNAGILIYVDSENAVKMLRQLREMFEYQYQIASAATVSITDEVTFIRNYLLLEQSRKPPFDFSIDVHSDTKDYFIPTLLLIPFVENAAKHSSGQRNIRINITVASGELTFTCSNTYDSMHPSTASPSGGIGIDNTRRRLSLIYGSSYRLSITRIENTYTLTLTIPINYVEMPDSRR